MKLAFLKLADTNLTPVIIVAREFEIKILSMVKIGRNGVAKQDL
uniref:Uncharacterized protein n=1 Tax=Rhodnius prolixus TaxID=13249 RepID=T1HMU4_RHOPR